MHKSTTTLQQSKSETLTEIDLTTVSQSSPNKTPHPLQTPKGDNVSFSNLFGNSFVFTSEGKRNVDELYNKFKMSTDGTITLPTELQDAIDKDLDNDPEVFSTGEIDFKTEKIDFDF